MTDEQIRQALTRYIKQHDGHKPAAETLNISQGYLSDILSGRRVVPDSVLAALGLERKETVSRIKSPVSR
jgi:hypothetical protein